MQWWTEYTNTWFVRTVDKTASTITVLMLIWRKQNKQTKKKDFVAMLHNPTLGPSHSQAVFTHKTHIRLSSTRALTHTQNTHTQEKECINVRVCVWLVFVSCVVSPAPAAGGPGHGTRQTGDYGGVECVDRGTWTPPSASHSVYSHLLIHFFFAFLFIFYVAWFDWSLANLPVLGIYEMIEVKSLYIEDNYNSTWTQHSMFPGLQVALPFKMCLKNF